MANMIYVAFVISCLLGVQAFPHEESSLGIVGGNSVKITDAPFMGRLCFSSFFCCGAAIVHNQFLITSASCYYIYQDGFQMYVIVGTDKTYTDGEAYRVENGYPHPNYIPGHEHDYDVALIKLVKPLKFNDKVQSITLAKQDLVVPEGATFDTLGFGSISQAMFDTKLPSQLQKVSVPLVPSEKCLRKFSWYSNNMICAGAEMQDSCIYDDGGPLVYNNTLVGVLISEGCGYKYHPSVYMYIPALREFIDKVIEVYG